MGMAINGAAGGGCGAAGGAGAAGGCEGAGKSGFEAAMRNAQNGCGMGAGEAGGGKGAGNGAGECGDGGKCGAGGGDMKEMAAEIRKLLEQLSQMLGATQGSAKGGEYAQG